MKNKIFDLIDFKRLNVLLEGFNKTTGFVTAILDLEGNVLSQSGWRQICTQFHRVNPKTANQCKISDTELANKLEAGEEYHFYKCLNGLVDVAVPIVINGEHIANLFTGQFFLEKPDYTYFKNQAEKYGFEEKNYLDALDKVPLLSEKEVKTALDFLLDMTQLISEIGAQKLEQIELNKALTKSEEQFRSLYNNSPDMYASVSPKDATILLCNATLLKETGYLKEEVIGAPIFKMYHKDCMEKVKESFEQFTKTGIIKNRELILKRKNGSKIEVSLNVYGIKDENGNISYSISSWRDISEYKLAEFKKAEALERQTKAEGIAKMGTFSWNPTTNKIHWSDNMYRLYGVKPSNFSPSLETASRFIHPDDINIVNGIFNKLITEKKAQTLSEYRIITTENKTLWLYGTSQVLLDKNGQIKEVIGIVKDITEKKLIDIELSQNQKRLTDAEVIGKTGNWSYKVETGEVIWSDGMYLIYGRDAKKDNPTYENLVSWIHEDDRKLHNAYFDRMLNAKPGEKTEDLEYRVTGRDGKEQWLKVKYETFFNDAAKPTMFFGTALQITENKEAEKTLKESEERFNLAVKGSNDGIWDWDNLESDEYWWSDRVYEILGYKPDEVEARISNWQKWMHPDDSDAVVEVLTKHLEENFPYQIEFRMQKKNGNYVWVAVSGESVRDKNGKPVRMAGSFSDITERKLAEEEIEKHRKNLEELIRERTLELETKISEIQRMNKLFVGRELRMKELKMEMNQLKEKLKNQLK